MNEIEDLVKRYRPSDESMEMIDEIFTQDDPRYSDPWSHVAVAGFIDNDAISIEKNDIISDKVSLKNINGPQKEMKAISIKLLKKHGYKIKGIEVGFEGGIVDVLGGNKEKTIPVECGPCNIRKAIDYLENENTELWVIKPAGKEYVLYIIKRSNNWEKMLIELKSRNIKNAKRAIGKAFKTI